MTGADKVLTVFDTVENAIRSMQDEPAPRLDDSTTRLSSSKSELAEVKLSAGILSKSKGAGTNRSSGPLCPSDDAACQYRAGRTQQGSKALPPLRRLRRPRANSS